MATAVAFAHLLLFLVLVSPVACYSASPSHRCDWCPRWSTASLLPPDATITGAACGYGGPAAAAELADGSFHIAAVNTGFFRQGQACGACYQLRCRGRSACAKDGVKVVVVADVPETNSTGGGERFMLTKDAFAALTTAGADGQPAVDVDFRRIPCAYKSKNLAVRVEETSSRDKGHLAVRFLYQGGQTDIVAVEVARAEIPGATATTQSTAAPSLTTWQYMTQREGSPGVWRTSRTPAGPLRLRLVVTAGSGGKWLRAEGVVLPAEWQAGAVYDTGLRVTDVAASTCGGASCSASGDGEEE
ncbi:expansin-like A4 [Triticum urartu]|uniref:Expansin-like EG45 domain-containing protein n=1 Tax=Triticum urartu TaxID=4572 RepID=A0A8R7RB07_TRIUA|nr:expansin-like A4 [Triticum urartu]